MNRKRIGRHTRALLAPSRISRRMVAQPRRPAHARRWPPGSQSAIGRASIVSFSTAVTPKTPDVPNAKCTWPLMRLPMSEPTNMLIQQCVCRLPNVSLPALSRFIDSTIRVSDIVPTHTIPIACMQSSEPRTPTDGTRPDARAENAISCSARPSVRYGIRRRPHTGTESDRNAAKIFRFQGRPPHTPRTACWYGWICISFTMSIRIATLGSARLNPAMNQTVGSTYSLRR